MHVDYDERQQHFLRRNLIDGAKTLVEMRRRVDMGTPLSNMSELLHFETVFLDRVQRRPFLLAEALPVRRARPKRVREIDESLGRQGGVDITQACGWRGRAGRRARCVMERAHRAERCVPCGFYITSSP